MSKELSIKNSNDLVFDLQLMEQASRLAVSMAKAEVMIPKHLHNKPADCMAIIIQSAQWGMNCFAVAQKTHLVNGTLGYEAQLINAVISSSKAIQGRFKYEYQWKEGSKDGLVRVGAVLHGDSEITWGEWLNTALVTTKNSPLWKTAPKQQAAYLAVKYWSRMYTPDIILGVYSVDELQDTEVKEREINPKPKFKEALEPQKQEAETEADVEEEAEIDCEELYIDYVSGMNDCETLEQLTGLSKIIADDNSLSSEIKARLRMSFADRQRELKILEKAKPKQ